MANSTKHSLMAIALLVISIFGSGTCMAMDEFGARFTNTTPAAFAGESVIDNMAVAQDEPSAEGLNDISPAAGEPTDTPVVPEPAAQDETGNNHNEIE